MTALPIPLVALQDCGAILGRRGAGKSATKQLLLEHELDAGHRCVLIDPKGDSWGIRLNPDKTPSRFDVPIFGGEHGDLPLVDSQGAALGRMIATHALSCVVDLSSFSTAGMRRFMRDFAEALFENNRAPLTLFVDEADQLAPQTVPSDMAKLLHEMERLIRQGRQRGIFMWMLTQRPQVLNKNLLSQAETLIAMKMTTPHDRKAIADWLEAHDPALAKDVMATLSSLAVGEAWAWVPAADFLERVRFPLFSTYDSGRTPRHGEIIEGVTLPPIDLGAVSAALSDVVEEEKVDTAVAAYDAGAAAGARTADLKTERDALRQFCERKDARIAELERKLSWLTHIIEQVRIWVGPDASEVPAEGGGCPEVDDGHRSREVAPSTGTIKRQDERTGGEHQLHSTPAQPQGVTAGEHGTLSRSALKMLNTLELVYPRPLTLKQCALLSGVSIKSSQLRAYWRELLGAGVRETVDGKGAAPNSGPAGLRFALQDPVEIWADIVRPAEAKMLRAIAQHGPITKPQAAALAGISPTSSAVGATIKTLLSYGLIREGQHKKFHLSEDMKA